MAFLLQLITSTVHMMQKVLYLGLDEYVLQIFESNLQSRSLCSVS